MLKQDTSTPYNRDIFFGEEVLKRYPQIRELLNFKDFQTEFRKADEEAKRRKSRVVLFGTASVVFGLIGILGVIAELAVPLIFSAHVPVLWLIVVEVCCLLAILIPGIDRLCFRNKDHYRLALYKRERLRHWQYQMFLDGAFVEQCVKETGRVQQFLCQRLEPLKQEFKSESGSLERFVQAALSEDLMLFSKTEYGNAKIHETIIAFLLEYRFGHQTEYVRRALADSNSEEILSRRQKFHWSESVAKGALIAACFFPLLQLFLTMFESESIERAHHSLAGLALVSLAFSAFARAYRNGLGLPEEIESYEEYVLQVEILRAKFDREVDPKRKQSIHKEMEQEAEKELRRFLQINGKSTFVL